MLYVYVFLAVRSKSILSVSCTRCLSLTAALALWMKSTMNTTNEFFPATYTKSKPVICVLPVPFITEIFQEVPFNHFFRYYVKNINSSF